MTMTLDIAKFISNSIKTQAKIQHLDIKTKTTTSSKIPDSVKSIISDDYGEKYLLDADYVSFFWGAIEKDDIKKLFNVVDKALGKSANKLTDTDFKKIDIKETSDDAEDKSKDDDVEDADEETEDIEIEDVEENNDDDTVEDDDQEELNEDDKEIEVQTSIAPTTYFFLKITLK